MIRNFLFHRVNPKREKLWDPMDVRLFERCVKFISSRYQVELLEDIVLGKIPDTGNMATIVFDDGFADNLEFAAPILRKYNCKASFYVVTDCIDRNIPTWTYVLEHRFQYTQQPNIELPLSFIPEALKAAVFLVEADRIAYVQKLKPFLKTLTHEERTETLNLVQEQLCDVELPKIMMNWAQVAELKAEGHYIGSHTHTHAMLGTMNNREEITAELKISAERIQSMLGHTPLTISYPVGSYTEQTKTLAREAGYKAGLAVNQKFYEPLKQDLFEIPRIELYSEPWWKTNLRIAGTLPKLKSLIGYS